MRIDEDKWGEILCFVRRNFQQCEEVSVKNVEIFKITLTLLVTIKTMSMLNIKWLRKNPKSKRHINIWKQRNTHNIWNTQKGQNSCKLRIGWKKSNQSCQTKLQSTAKQRKKKLKKIKRNKPKKITDTKI